MEARELTDSFRALAVKYACEHAGSWEWHECFSAQVNYVNGTIGIVARFRCHCADDHEVRVLGDLDWGGEDLYFLDPDTIVSQDHVLAVEFKVWEDEQQTMKEIRELAR